MYHEKSIYKAHYYLGKRMVSKLKLTVFGMVALLGVLVFRGVAFAGTEEYRQCSDSEPCEIGEFLFDDEYTPIATASCDLTSRDPTGTLILDQESMTAASDGWYSIDVDPTGRDYGLYRSQMCCTHLDEYLCIDKSFEIASSSAGLTQDQVADAVWDADRTDHNTTDSFGENLQTSSSISQTEIADAVWEATRSSYTTSGSFGENLQNPSSISAADVWAYPQRSLTNFGTLISDIWSYSSRSLDNISSLVSNIWNHDDRTITSAAIDNNDNQELATETTVIENSASNTQVQEVMDQIEVTNQEIKNNQYLLEQLVNAPIVETFIEEGEVAPPTLQSKIQETKKVAQQLSTDVDGLQKEVISLNTNWEDSSYQLALTQMTTATRVLGANSESGTNSESISSKINWLDKKWNDPIIANLSTQTNSALADVSSISREIKSYGKTFISKQYLDITAEHIGKLDEVIGQEGDSSTDSSLFGYISYLEETHEALVKQSLELDQLIEHWHEYTDGEIDMKLSRIKRDVLAINHIPEADLLLQPKAGDKKHRENLALALQGLIQSNSLLLAQDSDQVMQSIWLEHGSVIFRSLVTNPSDSIAQKVDVRYYLPQEVDLEDIIKIEDDLTAEFDVEKNSLYVSGEILLDPGETRTFVVEIVDIWTIPDEEIASIRKQTNTLFDSLKNTSYFAQGSTIKADIDVHLDKIEILQKNNQTPELKIKSYREASLELQAARAKLESLKTLVASTSSVGTVLGFVGGVQTVAVWGLIIILIAGFVFLSIYLKMISRSSATKAIVDAQNENKKENPPASEKASKKETKSKKIAMSKSKDLSTISLIKEIISLKLNKGEVADKDSNNQINNKKPNIMLISIILILLLVIIILLFSLVSGKQKAELLSPLPHEDYYPELSYLSPSTTIEKIIQPEGVVLGAHSDQESSLSAKIDIEPQAQHEYQTTVRIPDNYKAINVRTEPSTDSDVISRIYIDQQVTVLYQLEDWILIQTKTIDPLESIKGWILKTFTDE